MGTVYLAAQEGQVGLVAIKTIRSEFVQEEGFRRRFAREAEAASSVRSSYTVRVKSFDTYAREPWIATEYVEGVSLLDHVRSHGSLSLPEAVDLALGLTFGLASIHKAGLVHRDLKPGNVLLTDDGPKIIDFGLAYGADFSHATHAGTVLGTPGYFSPEQVKGHPVGAPSDIFSLGAVLAFASSGEPAFRGITALTAQYHVVHEEPDLSDVPDELRELISACMRKDSHMRPPLNSVLAHLTALRSHDYRETSSGYRWPDTRGKREISVEDSSTVVQTSITQNHRRRWPVIAAAAAGVLAIGVTVGHWGIPGDGQSPPSASASSINQPPLDTLTPTPQIESPAISAPPSDSPEPENPQMETLLTNITYNSARGVCVLDDEDFSDEGMAIASSSGFAVSVTSSASKGKWVNRAVIHVRIRPATHGSGPDHVYLKLPKGEQVPLAIPKGKTSWSFQWPDVLETAELGNPYDWMSGASLFGTYTVVVTRDGTSIGACEGFTGDPKRFSEEDSDY